MTVSIAAGCAQTTEPPIAAAPAALNAACASEPVSDTTTRGAHLDRSIESSGGERTYKRYTPAAYDGTPTPLVIDLHGYLSGAAGQIAMSDLATDAESGGFIVATPQGSGPMPYWNAVPQPDLPDDVGFIADVIDDVSADLCVDQTRVYVQGFSNGAFLASLIACRLSDKVAAVAAVAGLQLPRDCSPERPVPILAIHGTEDRFVSFEGSPNDALAQLSWNDDSTHAFADLPFAPATKALAAWANLNGCAGPARAQEVTPSVNRAHYDDCRGGATVELYILAGAGHTWPASDVAKASESILGPATDEISANEVVWAFFQDHRLTG